MINSRALILLSFKFPGVQKKAGGGLVPAGASPPRSAGLVSSGATQCISPTPEHYLRG